MRVLGGDWADGRAAGLLQHALTRGWHNAVWAGLMNPVAYYLILFGAYDRLPGQEAMALNYTWALVMAFLAVPILGQRLTLVDILAGLIAYAGVWVIATRGAVLDVDFADPLGVALALVSTLVWALYWLINTRDRRLPLVAQWRELAGGRAASQPSAAGGPRNFLDGLARPRCRCHIGLFEMGIAFCAMATRTASSVAYGQGLQPDLPVAAGLAPPPPLGGR